MQQLSGQIVIVVRNVKARIIAKVKRLFLGVVFNVVMMKVQQLTQVLINVNAQFSRHSISFLNWVQRRKECQLLNCQMSLDWGKKYVGISNGNFNKRWKVVLNRVWKTRLSINFHYNSIFCQLFIHLMKKVTNENQYSATADKLFKKCYEFAPLRWNKTNSPLTFVENFQQ